MDLQTDISYFKDYRLRVGNDWSISNLVSRKKGVFVVCRVQQHVRESMIKYSSRCVIFCIQLLRLCAGRAAVNVQVVDGSLTGNGLRIDTQIPYSVGMRTALSLLFAIYKTLAQVGRLVVIIVFRLSSRVSVCPPEK